jgi:hypothetical protein
MFRSSLNRLLDWAEGALAPDEADDFGVVDEPPPPHSHRRKLRWERERRPGSVPHRPAHCISPVERSGRAARMRDGSAR